MPTVLIADDDADHRELISLALARLGHEVVEAFDADSAHRALEAGGIDAVLLDVRMPGTSGIEVCRLIRSDPATAHLPIMVISADVTHHCIRAAIDAGADDYLTKPYHRADLLSRVELLLARRGKTAKKPATAATAALLAARAAVPRGMPMPLPRPVRRTA